MRVEQQTTAENRWTSTIVGVVEAVYQGGPEKATSSFVYHPFRQDPAGEGAIVARVSGDANLYAAVIRDAVAGLDPAVPVYDVRTLENRLTDTLASPRFYTMGIGFLAGFALLLAAIGIYGTASYSVTQRTKEIGVRVAVGATPGAVRAMLMRQSLLPLGIGLVLGLGIVMETGQVLESLIAGVEPAGLSVLAAGIAILLAAGLIAVWRATARVTSIDPMAALRSE